MAKAKVLVIDDNKTLLRELKEMFTLEGYEVEVSSSGTKAIETVYKYRPDIIFLDLKLDEKSGFQIADDIRHLPEISGIPIIAMTGYYTEQQHKSFMKKCGINDYLIKPFQPMDVFDKLETFIVSKYTPAFIRSLWDSRIRNTRVQ
jgi:DNA-binding response OmpR family regulator